MQDRLVGFIQVLRSHQLRISPAETLDAMGVATTLGYADRDMLRDGLGLVLAKTNRDKAIYRQCFDHYFSHDFDSSPPEQAEDAEEESPNADSLPLDSPGLQPEGNAEPQEAQPSPLDEALAESPALAELANSALLQALRDNDRNTLALAVARAAESVSLSNIRAFTQRGQYTRRMLDALGEEVIRRGVIELEQQDSPALAELQGYRDMLRERVRDTVEREYLLQAQGRNAQRMDEILARTRLNNIELHYQQRVYELVRKMARKLAARYARKRRVYKRGQLDMGRTLRRGIPHDGVMFNTYWRRVNKSRPQVLALCDVSGSVAAYAKFLLIFLYSLADVLPRMRSFAFSSHLGEITDLFRQHPVEKAVEIANWRYGGSTDYGASLEDFSRLALDDVGSNTTVIILGDARNNHGDPRLDLMQQLYQRAKQVIWLNPESRRAWGTGDSEMIRYQSTCHFSAQCNNLEQLERFIDQLLRNTR